MKTAISDIVDSRTFYIAVVDAVVSTLSVMLALFFNPVIVDKILAVVAIWQPVVIAWIVKLAVQNTAGIKADAVVEAAKVTASAPTDIQPSHDLPSPSTPGTTF
jgi:hypothetical protein